MYTGFVRIHLLTIIILTLTSGVLLGNVLFRVVESSFNFGFSGDSLPLAEKTEIRLTVETMTRERFGWTHEIAERNDATGGTLYVTYESNTVLGAEIKRLSLPGSSRWYAAAEVRKDMPELAKHVLPLIGSSESPPTLKWNMAALAVLIALSALALIGIAFLSEFWIRSREHTQGKSKSDV